MVLWPDLAMRLLRRGKIVGKSLAERHRGVDLLNFLWGQADAEGVDVAF